MNLKLDTYNLLVEKLGEPLAYRLCEELGGVELKVPKKAHKIFRANKIVQKAIPLIEDIEKDNPKKKTFFIKKLAKQQGLTRNCIYKIIRKVRDGK